MILPSALYPKEFIKVKTPFESLVLINFRYYTRGEIIGHAHEKDERPGLKNTVYSGGKLRVDDVYAILDALGFDATSTPMPILWFKLGGENGTTEAYGLPPKTWGEPYTFTTTPPYGSEIIREHAFTKGLNIELRPSRRHYAA